jgi:hypothetical protein
LPPLAFAASDLPVVNDESDAPTWTSRAYRWLLIGGFAYMAFLALLLVPVVQRKCVLSAVAADGRVLRNSPAVCTVADHRFVCRLCSAIFMHNIRIPLRTKFSAPERYGLAPFKTRNLAIATADGETLGAWHTLSVVLADPALPHSHLPADARPFAVRSLRRPTTVYREQLDGIFPPTGPFDESVFDEALRARPTVLFLHGNVGPHLPSDVPALQLLISASINSTNLCSGRQPRALAPNEPPLESVDRARRQCTHHRLPRLRRFDRLADRGRPPA